MKTEAIKNFFKAAKNMTLKKSPEILTSLGIFGVGLTVVCAVRDTIKAKKKIDEAVKTTNEKLSELPGDLADIQINNLNVKGVVKVAWKCYIPTAAAAVSTVLCIFGANHIRSHRETALIAACSLAETALEDFKRNTRKILETDGHEEQKIVDAVAQDQIDRKPLTGREMIFVTGKGETLCYDPFSGRYFQSDTDELRKLENIINKRLLLDNTISLNEYYDLLGLPEIEIGGDLGWSIGRETSIEFVFGTAMAPDEKPCIVVSFDKPPQYGYSERW